MTAITVSPLSIALKVQLSTIPTPSYFSSAIVFLQQRRYRLSRDTGCFPDSLTFRIRYKTPCCKSTTCVLDLNIRTLARIQTKRVRGGRRYCFLSDPDPLYVEALAHAPLFDVNPSPVSRLFIHNKISISPMIFRIITCIFQNDAHFGKHNIELSCAAVRSKVAIVITEQQLHY